MTRYEFIVKGGKEEMAKAIGFCLATYEETLENGTYSCDEFIRKVKIAQEKMMPWLDEEVDG